MSARDRSQELERDLFELANGSEAEATPSASLRARLLATLDTPTRFAGFVDRVAEFLDLGDEATRTLLDRVREVEGPLWEDGRVAGVRLHHFDAGPRIAGAHCGIVFVQPGTTYPSHRHRGDEWSFVLQGRAREDSGRVWAAGDLVHSPEGSRHHFKALGPEPFVFVVAVHDGIDHEDGD